MPIEEQQRHKLTPQQRLALSRRALVHQLEGGSENDRPHAMSGGHMNPEHSEQFDDLALGVPFRESSAASSSGSPWLSVARSLADRWWRRHPAHAVGQLARPLLARYAKKEPAKLMAIAAATGAALVVVKPWRLLSLTAVLAAVLKTSDLADLVNTLMQQKTTNPRKDTPS
jgi:hypothetical protein